jgi:hypothetical protein
MKDRKIDPAVVYFAIEFQVHTVQERNVLDSRICLKRGDEKGCKWDT